MNMNIVVRTTFTAIHSWPSCPFRDTDYLRYPHRHVFYVTLKFPVEEDRDSELISIKEGVDKYLRDNWDGRDVGSLSCGAFCLFLLGDFPDATYVSVFEDNENGVEVERKMNR